MLNNLGWFDPHFNDGIVSIKIDADGVACKDDDLISHIENMFRGIEPYLNHLGSEKIIEISSFTTVMLVVVEVQKKRALSNIGTRRMGGFTLLCTSSLVLFTDTQSPWKRHGYLHSVSLG